MIVPRFAGHSTHVRHNLWGPAVRFVPARQVGGELISGMVEEWEWYRNGGSYAKHRDFLTVHWEVQEKSPRFIRLHVDSPSVTVDPVLNRIKADIVEAMLSLDMRAEVQARGFEYQLGRLISDKAIADNKSTEPFRIELSPPQLTERLEQGLVLVHESLGSVVQGTLEPFRERIRREFS